MYCTLAEVRASAQGMTSSASPAVTDDLARDLIERASRMFDNECGVAEGFFESALYPEWESLHVYIVGDVVTPTTPNAHKYRVTTAGTSGATEPTWPTGSGLTVTNGTVVFTENGADVVATERTFYGDGTNILKLDPYVPGSLSTTIAVPADYTTPDFIIQNGHLLRSSDTGIPNPAGSYNYGWMARIPVTVTAKWGYESTPADVKAAVIEMAINLWREVDPATAKLSGMDGSIRREAIPPRVKEIAKFYRVKCARSPLV